MLIGRRQIAKNKTKNNQSLKIHPVKKDNKKLRKKKECTGKILSVIAQHYFHIFSMVHILVSNTLI